MLKLYRVLRKTRIFVLAVIFICLFWLLSFSENQRGLENGEYLENGCEFLDAVFRFVFFMFFWIRICKGLSGLMHFFMLKLSPKNVEILSRFTKNKHFVIQPPFFIFVYIGCCHQISVRPISVRISSILTNQRAYTSALHHISAAV